METCACILWSRRESQAFLFCLRLSSSTKRIPRNSKARGKPNPFREFWFANGIYFETILENPQMKAFRRFPD
ncbi:hypothetical protein ILYODFUR_005292 [Ilyodon furcidens]|uniref:Uncharacterized protein n=1 Tax=Ilyodon furcidens TaxID=33524 RepID=A0ABV0V0L2_9TELE